MILKKKVPPAEVRYPGTPTALDGSQAVVEMETAASEAAGAYPITPSTQMGEGWALAVAAGKTNVNGRRLLFFEPEGEHAAAAVTAGMSMAGLRAANFSSGQGIAYMHESLYAAVGKRLTYVLNVACRAMTKHALNVHAGHDDYHAVDDTGFFQLFAKNAQEAADLNLIAHRVAELSLNPGICAQDGFLTSHVIESMRLPERDLIKEYLGDPADLIDTPTPAQRLVFGETRRRIPEMFDYDYPTMLGVVQNQDSYAQGVAAQRPFYFDHLQTITDQAMNEFAELTGRRYERASGYRMEDAEYVLVGQGSVVANAEAVCDYLRDERGLKVGVVNATMFRPFPADCLTRLLAGRRRVTVLERVDQPLAVDAPLLREIRAVMTKAVENHRAGNGRPPYPGVVACHADQVPDFYSACFGLGSRDVQPGDLVAAVENMLADGQGLRQAYLGLDFIRRDTRLPKLQIWQEQLLDSYPHVAELSLPSSGDVDLLPRGSTAIRIHSVGGWGAITMGKNLAMTAAELAGLHIKANPKYGSEKKGQPTTFYAVLAHEPIRLNCELKHVHVVLSPDANVFRHSNPIAGLADRGVFIIQSDLTPERLWSTFPAWAQRDIRARKIRCFALDGFAIAQDEASDPELRYRMQGAAFMGAFFRSADLAEREKLDAETLFGGIRKQLTKKFGHLGERVVEDNVRVIQRGYDEVRSVDLTNFEDRQDDAGVLPAMPSSMDNPLACPGVGDAGRFWEQVGFLYKTGDDGIADPFAALSAIPAGTSTMRDMTDVRFEVPEFVPERCTGCSQCWVQCPDAAIPGLVSDVQGIIAAAIHTASNQRSFDRVKQILRPLTRETQRILRGPAFHDFASVISEAYQNVAGKMDLDPERRKLLDEEFGSVYGALEDFPIAKTTRFFDTPESREKGSGGLLSITINPEACKGCNICVEVCPDEALLTVKQTDDIVRTLRRNWEMWQHLPDTPDRFINVSDVDEGIGVLSSLLLKKDSYRSMFGGDGACMGCGEKTAVHLVLSAVNALMLPRVEQHVKRLDGIIADLDGKTRSLLTADADLDALLRAPSDVKVDIDSATRSRVERLLQLLRELKDLRWRYTEGPSGHGRATLGISNATGCSSVWGSTYPFNPYPFPWVNHLFQDAPSIAIGLFEGHMRKMADGFKAIRQAQLELDDLYDPETHDREFEAFTWHQFTDEEFKLCPPVFAIGGDGAMLDIGFQNLSRLLASGKPIRVMVLDTQVYSNTGGQACTSGFLGQVSDMAAFGASQHGKEEVRKEISLLAIAHRNVFVHQSSQASPSHLLAGVLRGLNSKRPSVFVVHCPCPPEHGLADDSAAHAARLALESRAFPLLTYDPTEGLALADCLSLDGNPSASEAWPSYDLKYVDDDGTECTMSLPVTIADWAATEARFKKHFRRLSPNTADDELIPFHEYLERDHDEVSGLTPFIYAIDGEKHLTRLAASPEMVDLARDRQIFWQELQHLAGVKVPESVQSEVSAELEGEFDAKLAALRTQYESQLADLRARYPQVIARRLAEGLLSATNGTETVHDLLARVQQLPDIKPLSPMPAVAAESASIAPSAPATPGNGEPAATAAGTIAPPAPAAEEAEDEEEGLVMEPYIESARCTSCDECTNLNNQMFAYNDQKQAYIKDASAGTFRELVMAAERCPVAIIHPGTPLNPREKGLDKWLKRAEAFA